MTPIRECLSCCRPMRPGGTLVDQYPGAIKHGGRGLCSTCYGKPEIREQYDTVLRAGEDLLAEVAMLLRWRSAQDVVAALGITPGAIARAARRHQRPDLARPFEHLRQPEKTARRRSRRHERRSAA